MNMRPLWRSLLLVFVLWFALSPTLCFASETVTESVYDYGISTLSIEKEDFEAGEILLGFQLRYLGSGGKSLTRGIYDNVNSVTASANVDISSWMYEYMNGNMKIYNRISIESSGNDIILYDKGQVMDFSATNLMSNISVYNSSGTVLKNSNWYYSQLYKINVNFVDRFGNVKVVELSDYTVSQSSQINSCINLMFSTIVPVDSYKIYIDLYTSPLYANINDVLSEDYSYTASYGFTNSMFDLGESEQDNNGFFGSIIEWLSSIKDGITDTVNSIKSGFSSVVQSVTELPSNIWNLIETGLKNLFVPSETDITEMKDKWDTLLADRFGVVYESGALVIDIANSVSEASTSETITFPSVSYNFSGTDFTFGGYEVDVIPNGFEFLADILKGVLDIVCTLAFINAMRRKYDELMMR